MGQDVVVAMGFAVLCLFVWPPTAEWLGPLVTVAHEGGHMIVFPLTGRGLKHFSLADGGGGETEAGRYGWASMVVSGLAGYTAPPLAGLLGASLVIGGRSWSLLWATLLLLLGAWSQCSGALAGAFLLLAMGGIGTVAVTGGPQLQSAVAVALVWLMLLGGVRAVAVMSIREGSDAWALWRSTWIPPFLRAGLFWFVAIVCLWLGGRRLLGL